MLDEDIKKTATAIQSLSPKPKHKFRTPADFNAKKGDQYRRLAIDFIEVVQGISDEDGKGPNAFRHEDLIYNFILQMLGYIGKKLLE